jgi:hypothetical protein
VAQLGEIANVSGYKPGPALTAAGGVRSATLGQMNLYATMQGQRVLMEHFYAMAAIYQPVMMVMTQYFGQLMAEYAKALHFPNIKTKETYDSIHASPVQAIPGGAAIQVSVGTEQAKFLEFGFVHHRSGAWIHNPFMIPAADAVAPMYVDALQQFMQVAQFRKFFTGPASEAGGNEILGAVRNALYSYSKYAGDIQVLGFGGLSASRGTAIKGAKGIGNIQAAQNSTIIARLTRIGVGRLGGTVIRGGSFGGGVLSGPGGRIYNRMSGRVFGGSLSGLRLS